MQGWVPTGEKHAGINGAQVLGLHIKLCDRSIQEAESESFIFCMVAIMHKGHVLVRQSSPL